MDLSHFRKESVLELKARINQTESLLASIVLTSRMADSMSMPYQEFAERHVAACDAFIREAEKLIEEKERGGGENSDASQH